MSRLSLVFASAAAVVLLSSCDRISRIFLTAAETNIGEALVFDAVRKGQSLYVSEILWARLYSLDFMGGRGDYVERTFGVSSEDAQVVWDFAIEAKSRMRELQRNKAAEMCAKQSSIDSRFTLSLAHLEMERDVELFEKTLILELFELLGTDRARNMVQTIHEARLRNDTPGSASADATVFHLVDDRDWQQYLDDFCATAAEIAANEAAL